MIRTGSLWDRLNPEDRQYAGKFGNTECDFLKRHKYEQLLAKI